MKSLRVSENKKGKYTRIKKVGAHLRTFYLLYKMFLYADFSHMHSKKARRKRIIYQILRGIIYNLYNKNKYIRYLYVYIGGDCVAVNSKELTENKKLEEILKMVEKIRYGSITLIIQDGVIIQVDKNEKIRIR